MRRSASLVLLVVGLVALVVGSALGCGKVASFSGLRPVAVQPLVVGTPLRKTFPAKPGTGYTLAVHVVFEREGLAERDGQLVVEARLPLVASIEDASGVPVANAVGWLDPNEPPTVLYGRSASSHQRRPLGAGPAELVAERLVGPYRSAAPRDVTFSVALGPDRAQRARVKEARVVIYDDAFPPSIYAAFAVAGAGALAFVLGAISLLPGLLRARGGGTRRRQIV